MRSSKRFAASVVLLSAVLGGLRLYAQDGTFPDAPEVSLGHEPIGAPWVDSPPRQTAVSKAQSASGTQTASPSASRDNEKASVDSDRSGSSYVPMDSWVYPTLERLAALGLIPSQGLSIRPWTRQECRRQVREVEDQLHGFGSLDETTRPGIRTEAERLLPDLENYLVEPDDSAQVVLESAYARFGSIVGPALMDGFHFGQTWWNDFGRPLGRGGSLIAGYAVRWSSGRFFVYDRQELQTDPGLPAVTQQQSNFISQLDNTPFGSTPPGFSVVAPAQPAYVRQRPLDLYAGIAFAGNELSFGKQEIYWGPTTMGPFAFSSNAEPTYNLQFVSARPHSIPFFPSLGSYRFDFVAGKLSGQHYPNRPYFNGGKVELIFGQHVEVSFTRWSIFLGQGHPMTIGAVYHNLFSSNSTGTGAYGDRTDPGDRKSDFDFRLHVPGLRDLLTIYADAYADDEVNPIDAPRRVAWNPGMYLARLPWQPHMDFRFEMTSSEELARDEGGTRFFINNQYRNGNTNKGFLLGNATGRDARAFEGRLGYWVSPRTRLEVGYRQSKISENFLLGGGTVSDGFVKASWAFRKDWTADVFGQYERFLIPSMTVGGQDNGSARLQITWTPRALTIKPKSKTF